jgi:hypothetical protein
MVPLIAVAVLVVNDQLLKAAWPGFVTGKLSDAAGLVFFPFLLTGAWELGRRWLGRTSRAGLTAPIVAIAATGVGFTLVKVAPWAGDLYRGGLGLVQWPVTALGAALSGAPMPAPAPVLLVADPTDLAMLPALAVPLGIAIISRPPVAATWPYRRDLAIAALSVAMLLGAVIDGWAHSHLSSALESVLTPWHAIVYTAFSLLAAVLVGDAVLAARAQDARWSGATLTATAHRLLSLVPAGYGPTVVGIAIFVAAGLADTAWHVGFGIEADAEALVSPSHLLLGVGAALIALGPARSVWQATIDSTWPGLLPAVLAIGTITGLVGFATNLASPFVDAWATYPYAATSTLFWAIAPVGIASVGLQSAVVAGGLATLLRLWPRPPRGALAIVIMLAVAPLTLLHDQARLVLAPIVGAVLAETITGFGVRRGWSAAGRLRAVTTIAPAAMWVAVVVALAATGGVAWSAHLIGGALVVAASFGGLVGILTTLPSTAEES